MRPCPYPRESFDDSDVQERLLRLGRMPDMQKPSVRHLVANAYKLCFLMHDIAMARALLATVSFLIMTSNDTQGIHHV